MDLSSAKAVREFLAQCLAPSYGVERTPATLAKIMPGPLGDAVDRYAPHLARLREAADEAEQRARAARKAYADALGAWVAFEPPKTVFPVPNSSEWSWQCPKDAGGCGYLSVARFPTEQIAQGGYDDHLSLCVSEQTSSAPAVDPSQCQQNRTWNFIRPADQPNFGPHFYKEDGAGVLRCLYCDAPAHWGGESLVAPTVPTYVFNASSVNRNVKHFVDPRDPRMTRCEPPLPASAPMSSDEAARLPLCGACRRTVTGERD